MMMLPRAFLYSSSRPSSPTAIATERNAMLPKDRQPVPGGTVKKAPAAGRTKPARISSASPATSSKPVVIPTRTLSGGQRRSKGHSKQIRKMPESPGIPHDLKSISPSTAALLAVTSLPTSRHISSYAQSRRSDFRYAFIDENAISTDSDTLKCPLSSSSPQSWGVLLSPPNESEEDTSSLNSDSNTWPLHSMRSLSSESMPSLEADVDSSCSVSNVSTPAILIGRRSCSERKRLSSSASEDCVLDHPLLPESSEFVSDSDEEEVERIKGGKEKIEDHAGEIQSSATSKSSFKSNLTASLRILKSAAISFSNFTAPVVRHNDHLAGLLLLVSPQFTDERRPVPSANIPDPALRRYLNPTIMSPAELHFHHLQLSGANCTASIQLQTYQRAIKTSRKASAPPVFTSHPLSRSSEETFTTATSRQREPRENSDFLRIIVLEMNMRKVGKLSDSPGRARLWLPARQGLSSSEVVEEVGIPRRWVGMSS